MARSLLFYCSCCGEVYAKFKAFRGGALQPFYAAHGRCPACPGDRWCVPGSIESAYLINRMDKGLLLYQLNVELAFLDNPNHPHNQKELP